MAIRTRGQKVALSQKQLHAFLDDLFGETDIHAARLLSVQHALLGVLHAASLAVHLIGRAMAQVRNKSPKHAIKQVAGLLDNTALPARLFFPSWIRFVVGLRTEVVVALDWTDFDKDGHSTLALYLITSHGRATPLLWKTFEAKQLKEKKGQYERELVMLLNDALKETVKVTILADRGFGSEDFYDDLDFFGFDYIIRFRSNIYVTNAAGETKKANEWLLASGRAIKIEKACVTEKKTQIGAVVVVREARMKQVWCLATNRGELAASEVVKLYGRRFSIEETFRDQKDDRFGMGLSQQKVGACDDRDRLLLLGALAEGLLTLLGAAGEKLGLDRTLKSNTAKKRTMSLFNQGRYWYDAIPYMDDEKLKQLMSAFEELLRVQEWMTQTFGIL